MRYLVSNLQKKNAKASVAEIEWLLQLYGDAAVGWLLTILLQEIDFKTSQQKDGSRSRCSPRSSRPCRRG